MSKIGDLTHARNLEDLQLLTDSQDVAAVLVHVPRVVLLAQDVDASGVTGVLVDAHEGEYTRVWVTESSRPWANEALYTRVV